MNEEENSFTYWLKVCTFLPVLIIILAITAVSGYLRKWSDFINDKCPCGGDFKPYSEKFAVCDNCGRKDIEG